MRVGRFVIPSHEPDGRPRDHRQPSPTSPTRYFSSLMDDDFASTASSSQREFKPAYRHPDQRGELMLQTFRRRARALGARIYAAGSDFVTPLETPKWNRCWPGSRLRRRSSDRTSSPSMIRAEPAKSVVHVLHGIHSWPGQDRTALHTHSHRSRRVRGRAVESGHCNQVAFSAKSIRHLFPLHFPYTRSGRSRHDRLPCAARRRCSGSP